MRFWLSRSVVSKNKIWQALEFGQGIRWIGKDEIETLACLAEVTEHVGAQERHLRFGVKGFQEAADERAMLRIELYGSDMRAASRQQFEGYAARAGKEVEGARLICLEINV